MSGDLRTAVKLCEIIAQSRDADGRKNAEWHLVVSRLFGLCAAVAITKQLLKLIEKIEKFFEVANRRRRTTALLQSGEYAILRHPELRVAKLGHAVHNISLPLRDRLPLEDVVF